MGGVDPWFDDLDEKKVSLDDIRPNKTGGASHSNHQSPRLFIILTFYVYTLYYFNRFFFPVIVDYDDLSQKYQMKLIVFIYVQCTFLLVFIAFHRLTNLHIVSNETNCFCFVHNKLVYTRYAIDFSALLVCEME